MPIKYGKYVELRPSSDIPALFDIKEMAYVYRHKNHITDVHKFMKYLYINRRRSHKFDRDKSFPLLSEVIKRRSYINKHLVIRLVEWQYIDNDGFWLKTWPTVQDAIFISICVRDYVNNHRSAKPQ